MRISRVIFLVISILVITRLFLVKDIEIAAIGTISVFVAATMVWFSGFWAKYLLGFGFMEQMATDYNNSGASAGAIALLGWIVLLLLAYGSFFFNG